MSYGHPEVANLCEQDRDLVLWLIGTHHGYGRPFFPPCLYGIPGQVASFEIDDAVLASEACNAPMRLDQGWFELASRVLQRYGPWECARLEAILRLADHAASAHEGYGGRTGSTVSDKKEGLL
jgi:CRISPR-associated endonuclease/helicase Cas3